MEEESATLNNTNDTCLNLFPAPRSRNDTLHEPFLNFDENSDLSFEDKSTIHNSLVALVKAEYPFDKALQDRAVQFLKSLEPEDDVRGQSTAAVKLVTELVPSSAGSPSGFIPSIVTLLSSPHSTVVAAALSFLNESSRRSSHAGVCYLVESGLVVKVLATVQPHTLPITGNETILDNLNWIIRKCVSLVIPSSLNLLGITTPVEKYNHREMIFQMVVLPSVRSLKTRRICLSRMTPTHLCGLSSYVGSAMIASADEQILGSPPIVKKWFAVLGSSFSSRLSLTVTSSTVLSPNNS
ncbi:hypothetical protein BLNAU_7185 [Blattamonas nauphoetae]|uniref:Uncharacterized protein n=1 Tax=Blattamonas nauphoetae TaxID=2049346 RepID=A0ABQ9Y1Y1_9EUKA|nr:hypothetical protein BLNAU_7185 [Blattamonas nauphoetae]